jgi:hypothetical protein
MTAKKRAVQTTLPSVPLSELPMMKALLAITRRPIGDQTTRKPRTRGTPKIDLTPLMLTIIDKLQILSLRRPRALIIVAQVLDGLLDRQLGVLDEHLDSNDADRSPAKTRVGAEHTRHDRRGETLCPRR